MYTQHVSRTREVHRLKQRCYPFGCNTFCGKLLIGTQKIDFLKILIACSIAGLSYIYSEFFYSEFIFIVKIQMAITRLIFDRFGPTVVFLA